MRIIIAALSLVTLGTAVAVPTGQASAISMPHKSYCLDISTRPQTGWTEGCGYTKNECARYGSQAVQELKRKYPKVKYSCTAQ